MPFIAGLDIRLRQLTRSMAYRPSISLFPFPRQELGKGKENAPFPTFTGLVASGPQPPAPGPF